MADRHWADPLRPGQVVVGRGRARHSVEFGMSQCALASWPAGLLSRVGVAGLHAEETPLHHNFVRLRTWDSLRTWNPEDRVRPLPWPLCGPGDAVDGHPKLDLGQHDEEHFRRLRERVGAAQERGIYVGVMLFEGWEAFRLCMKQLDWHAFAGPDNVNGIDVTKHEANGALVGCPDGRRGAYGTNAALRGGCCLLRRPRGTLEPMVLSLASRKG